MPAQLRYVPPGRPRAQWITGACVPVDGGQHQGVRCSGHLAFTTCGECHGWDLQGFEGDPAPSLVVAKAYSREAFRRLMREGTTLAGGESTPTGLMSSVARYRFNSMTDVEIDALHAFLVAQ